MQPLRLLDLFSGIGGFSLGLERTGGFKTVAFCETSEACRRVPANALGAPHRRDRLWVISYPSGERDGLPPLEIRTGWDKSEHRAWWDTEPDLGRVVDGVSAQPHRLAQLGNAVVPMIPQEIGRALIEAERMAA